MVARARQPGGGVEAGAGAALEECEIADHRGFEGHEGRGCLAVVIVPKQAASLEKSGLTRNGVH
jgi:hypothetical protein